MTGDVLSCNCGSALAPPYVEGHTYVCNDCAKVWTLNLYRDDCDIVLVQHAPVIPAGEPLDRTSPDSGSVTRHRRRRSSPHFERLRKQFPVERTGIE